MAEVTLLSQLKRIVSRLAAPAVEQIEYLRGINTYPSADELPLQFHDLTLSPSRLRTETGISDEVLRLIANLNGKLDSFSGDDYRSEWDASVLDRSTHWSEVRVLAKCVLAALA